MDPQSKLLGYTVHESDSFRGMMSNGVRLHLKWDKTSQPIPPPTAFYKRVVMSDLAHTQQKLKSAPHKVLRDVKSYNIETAFLTGPVAACLRTTTSEGGPHIPTVYALRPAPLSTPEQALRSRFAILMEDFGVEEGWRQEWLLKEKKDVESVLKTLATFHACFWEGGEFSQSEEGKTLEGTVWSNGGYMQPSLQGWDQLNLVKEGFLEKLTLFEDDLKEIQELRGVDVNHITTSHDHVNRAMNNGNFKYAN